MKIKRIQVKNIGPYVNENSFDFDTSDVTKRMVLIGGKNGAGKTTLFNAIKICLYGCIAYGFESNNAKYYAEIEKIINANEKLQKIGEAEVIIDLLMDDGKYDHTYTFIRSWKVAGKKIVESFTVYKDGMIFVLANLIKYSHNKICHFQTQVCPFLQYYFIFGPCNYFSCKIYLTLFSYII